MDYFKILNLNREPFSNSPDPEYFFQSRQHLGCLQKVELALRLRRGLNVVIGDIGTGKTTLCRQLIRRFVNDDAIETHLILDPAFSTPSEFLLTIAEMFEGDKSQSASNEWQIKEIIKQYLFRKGVDDKKTIILIIDEGQKIPVYGLEILRELLNYETNEFKLLQIVIFAQKEFENTLGEYANFADRINLKHLLGPMNFQDTRLMIQFRLQQSSNATPNLSLFTFPAMWAIYRETGGYPRKIINLCHRSILAMIIQNRSRAGWLLIRSCIGRVAPKGWKKWGRFAAMALAGFVLVFLTTELSIERFKKHWPITAEELKTAEIQGELFQPDGQETPKEEQTLSVNESRIETFQEPRDAPPPVPARTTTAIEPVSQNSKKISAIHNNYPDTLGKVALMHKETLWRLVEKVYGVFDNQHLKSIREVNPAITDPNRVETGQIIVVPAIPTQLKPLPSNIHWVEIEKMDNLEVAIDYLRSYPTDAQPIRLMPYWNNREGLKFSILFREYFEEDIFARNHLNKLAPLLVSKGKILSSWDNDTVFFSDPLLGRGSGGRD
ncbi:MAG: AAA family ATPase [Deltaproteobacteria bacterium]|nr:AAA family ATPase [Deltaproteobacteria bacterium]